ncbi:MAG: thioredoxin domain-containing protein [Acidobacteriota bacterium]
MSEKLVDLTDEDFDEKINSSKLPYLIDFYSNSCPPCLVLNPILKNLSQILNGKIIVGKLDVEQNTKTTSKHMIRSIPCMILFINGKEKDRLIGFHPKEKIREFLERYL